MCFIFQVFTATVMMCFIFSGASSHCDNVFYFSGVYSYSDNVFYISGVYSYSDDACFIFSSVYSYSDDVCFIFSGVYSYSDDVCKLWITLDYFFCNCTCLHLAFVNMERFLRLKDPVRSGQPPTTCSLVMWLGAPWIISLVQSVAQFMLSQSDHSVILTGICFISDKNFILLGVLFSFMIPMVIAMTFYGLCAHEINMLRAGKFVERVGHSNLNDDPSYQFGSDESIVLDTESDSSIRSSHDDADIQLPEHLQLSTVTTVEHTQLDQLPTVMSTQPDYHRPQLGGYIPPPPQTANVHETTSFCQDSLHHEADMIHETGHTNTAYTSSHSNITLEQSSCTLLLHDIAAEQNDHKLNRYPHHHSFSEPMHYNHVDVLREERVLSRIMCGLVFLCVTLWLPYSTSNVVYAMCEHCVENMSFVEMMSFRWLAYCVALIQPYLCVIVSQSLRHAVWAVLVCGPCRT